MALNTRDNRASAIGIDLNWLRVYHNPDGSFNQADRQQAAFKYAGLLSIINIINTRNRRAGAIGLDFSWLHVYPNPDGSIDAADRQQTGYKYPGISSSTGGGANRYRTLMGVGS